MNLKTKMILLGLMVNMILPLVLLHHLPVQALLLSAPVVVVVVVLHRVQAVAVVALKIH